MISRRRLYEERLAADTAQAGAGAEAPPQEELEIADAAAAGAAGAPPAVERAERAVARDLRRADLAYRPADVLIASLLGATALAVAAMLAHLDRILGLASIPVAAAAGLALPPLALAWLARRRSRRIDERLADALDLIVSALRSGFAAESALAHVAEELSGPVARELGELAGRLRLGDPPGAALRAFADACGGDNARLFARAVAVKWDVGGELAETLAKISATARERTRLRRQVRTLTAQGRLTAGVLFALPYVIGVGMYWINPDHVRVLWTDETGLILFKIGLGLQAVGAVWIWALVRARGS